MIDKIKNRERFGKAQTRLFVLSSLMFFATFNFLIVNRESLRRNGEIMLLELAPVDSRSLMQGDYMRLRYQAAQAAGDSNIKNDNGKIVVRIDENRVARFVRVYQNEGLAMNEKLLRYRRREGILRVASEDFFFQEGQAAKYERAKYGELRVAPGGDSLLIDLRDETYQPLNAN